MLWFRENRRLDRLEERFDELGRRLNALEMEWNDTYDKLRKTMGRIVKDRARMEAATEGEPQSTQEANPGTTHSGRLLSPHQMSIQQQILRRRAGG